MGLNDRLQHAWNAFMNKDPTGRRYTGRGDYTRPDRIRFSRGNERSIVTSVYNRISMDAAAIDIRHVKLDEDERYVSDIKSSLTRTTALATLLTAPIPVALA